MRGKGIRTDEPPTKMQIQAAPPSKESTTSKKVKAVSPKGKVVHQEISLESKGSTSKSSSGYSPLSVSQAGVPSSPNDDDDEMILNYLY